jgi:hypothetical protein
MTTTGKTTKLALRATVVTATAAACLIGVPRSGATFRGANGLPVDQAPARKPLQRLTIRADERAYEAMLNAFGLPASSLLGGALRSIDKLEGPQSPTGSAVATYRHGIWFGPNGKPISHQTAAARAYAHEHHLPMVVKIPQGAKVKAPQRRSPAAA